MERLSEGNLHSSCIPTNLLPTPVVGKDGKPYQQPRKSARGKIKIDKRLRCAPRMTRTRFLSIGSGIHRPRRLFPGFSPSLMPPTGDAPLMAGPGGESGVSASGRSDALAWAVAPRRGRESGGLGGFWLQCFEWKFGRGRKSRFEFLLSASPILIRDMALQIEGEIPHAGLMNAL